MLGRCILWQVPVYAPGTANSATFLPLKMSSVVFTCGPSAVITRNFASGSLSPVWIAIVSLPENRSRFLDRAAALHNVAGRAGGEGGTLHRYVISRRTRRRRGRPARPAWCRGRADGCGGGSGQTAG